MKKILTYATAALLAGGLLAGCIADDRNNFMVDDSIALTARSSLVSTSVHLGGIRIGIAKNGKGLSAATVTVSRDEADIASALKLYNLQNGTDYKILPSAFYTLGDEKIRFAADEVQKTVDLSWDPAALARFIEDREDYVIPLRIRSDDLEVNGEKNFVMVNVVRSTFSVSQPLVTRTVNRSAFERDEKTGEYKTPPQETVTLDLRNNCAIPGVQVTFPVVVDNSLVDAFNATQDETFTAAPEGLLTILTPTVTLAEGATDAQFRLQIDKEQLLTGGVLEEFPNYVIPVRLDTDRLTALRNGEDFTLDGVQFGDMTTYVTVQYAADGLRAVVRLWGLYSDGEGAWYRGIEGFPDGADRTVAMDDEFLYVPQHAGTPAIHALSLTTGRAVKTLDLGDAVSNGCTHPVSCVRMIPNEAGKDILLFCSLKGDGDQHLYVYAYSAGTDAAPVRILDYLHDVKGGADDWRRYGDRFTVKGTWQDGELWFHTWSSGGKTVVFTLKNGTVTNPDDPTDHLIDASDGSIRDVTLYPGLSSVLVTSPNASGTALYSDSGSDNAFGWNQWQVTAALPDFALTYGYNFFSFHSKDYMAYAQLDAANGNQGRLVILDDDQTAPAAFPARLAAQTNRLEFPIQDAEDFDVTASGYAGSSVADCCVREIEGNTYIATLVNGVGLSLFQLQ